MNENGPPSKYPYDPSLVAAVLFAVLYGLSTVAHAYQLLRGRTWSFIAFLIGSICEPSLSSFHHLTLGLAIEFLDTDTRSVQTVGYSCRAINASETPNWSQIPFIIQTLLPLLAPALYAASIYMLLGRLVNSMDAAHLCFIPTRWLTKIFVFGDILSFAFQCIGELQLLQSVSHHNQHSDLEFSCRRRCSSICQRQVRS